MLTSIARVTAGVLLMTVVGFLGPLAAQERIRVGWAGASPANSPIWVVQAKGYLKKHGLDAQVISLTASPIAIQAMLAGELDVIVTSVTTLVSARLAGADIVMILGMVPTFVDHIITQPNITSFDQLKGKMGGVNRIGSTSDLGLRLALRRKGIDPEKDVKIITAGENPSRLAAVSKAIVQFTIIPEPFVHEAEKVGLKDFFSIGSLKIPFWWNAVLVQESTLRSKRPMLLKFTHAMMEAVHYIKTEKEGTKEIFSKNLKLTDPEGLERAYRDYNGIFPENLMPTPDGVKTMLDDLAARNAKAAAADPKSFVDASLVQEVEASGFLKQLYKR
jgi:NitT/TauT family transport system substrate-binding protein